MRAGRFRPTIEVLEDRTAPSAGIEFWVAPEGNDAAAGTQASPFRTLERARDAVRALAPTMDQDIAVNIRDGTHRLAQPVVFDSRDSGRNGFDVVYRAAPGAAPVISGAIQVQGWAPWNGEIYRAFVGPYESRQLYVNGQRAVRAQTEPTPLAPYPVGFRPTYNPIPGVSARGGIEFIPSLLNPIGWFDPNLWGTSLDLNLTNIVQRRKDIEAVIVPQWKMMSVPVDSINSGPVPSTTVPGQSVGVITLQEPGWTNANVSISLFTGNTTNGSKIVSNISSTATILPGMTISAGTIIPEGTTVLSVDSTTQVTLSANATQTTSGTALAIRDASGDLVGERGLWSFWQVSRFENAYEFLDQPGEWYLDGPTGWLYYMPRAGEELASADVELPVLEFLIDGQGTIGQPVTNIRFEGLTFSYATWLRPSSGDGYVSDQSGFHLVGPGHKPNIIGHDPNVVPTPGNVQFIYAHDIQFVGNTFQHLGAVGLYFSSGSQRNSIILNHFEDISSAAVQLGGVSQIDAHPTDPRQVTRDNSISYNLIQQAGREYVDAAGIMVGFTNGTLISHNDISDLPWSGIALGWGWGLYDPLQPGDLGYPGTFPGLPGAVSGQWGTYNTPTTNHDNQILHNRIHDFLRVTWDGGAIYTTGFQGTAPADGLWIAWNLAYDKRPERGGNILYTDGGSRYITLLENASFDNPQGFTYFGPMPYISSQDDPLNAPLWPVYALLNGWPFGIPYGSEIGGCVTYGDILYVGNYWLNNWTTNPFPFWPNPSLWPSNPYFYDPCRGSDLDLLFPTNLIFVGNHLIQGMADVPRWLLGLPPQAPPPPFNNIIIEVLLAVARPVVAKSADNSVSAAGGTQIDLVVPFTVIERRAAPAIPAPRGGQGSAPTVGSVVFDELSGASLKGVEVVLEVESQGRWLALATTATDAQGQFSFPELPPGRYRIRLVASNFEVTGANAGVIEVKPGGGPLPRRIGVQRRLRGSRLPPARSVVPALPGDSQTGRLQVEDLSGPLRFPVSFLEQGFLDWSLWTEEMLAAVALAIAWPSHGRETGAGSQLLCSGERDRWR